MGRQMRSAVMDTIAGTPGVVERNEFRSTVTRRWFFQQCGVGLGASAAVAPTSSLAPRQPHYAPKAKRVIFLFMAGAPSHLELFDNKPMLAKYDGKVPPPDLVKGYRTAFIRPDA